MLLASSRRLAVTRRMLECGMSVYVAPGAGGVGAGAALGAAAGAAGLAAYMCACMQAQQQRQRVQGGGA